MNILLPNDSSVTIAGIHNGKFQTGKKYSTFSPWSGIATDYPGIVVN